MSTAQVGLCALERILEYVASHVGFSLLVRPRQTSPTPPSAAPLVPPPVAPPPVKKTPETIQLVVDTDPAGAEFYLNGKVWAQDTPAMVTQPYGVTVRIEMIEKGFQTWCAPSASTRRSASSSPDNS